MSKVARVFLETLSCDYDDLTFCCGGLHVRERWHYMWGLEINTASPCDKSCEGKPTLRQKDFSEEEVAQLKLIPFAEVADQHRGHSATQPSRDARKGDTNALHRQETNRL